MSIELIGFENLPNAFIKDIIITKVNSRENMFEVVVRVHDLPDRSVWSATDELFFQLMRVGLIFSSDPTEIQQLSNGEVSPTSLRYVSKSLTIVPKATEHSSYFELRFASTFTANTSNLAVFAFCFISKADISTFLGITVPSDYNGPIKSERILQSSNVVSTTNTFLRQDGTYWSGPVHEHDGVFMEGAYHKETPHNNLTRLSATNTKIKDKRQIVETKHSESQRTGIEMSNLFVSYSSETDINCMFMINMKTLLVNNTRYGSFLNKASNEVLDLLLSQTDFRMVSIQKQRIKAGFRSIGLGGIRRKADSIFSKKNIINTQDNPNGSLINKIRFERNGNFDVLPGEISNTSDYKKIADIQELFLGYGKEVRTFQFTDYEMTSNTPGDYQYKVELQFVDPVDKFLRNTLVSMKADISSVLDYLNIFMRKGSLATINAEDVVANYLSSYSYIYQLNRIDRLKLSLKYTSLLNPTTTNASSISTFLKNYRDLYNDFLVFIDHDDVKKNGNPLSVMAKESMSARTIISKTFAEIVVPSDNSLTFSYLPEGADKKVAVYSKSAFLQQSQQQIEEEFRTQPNFASAEVPSGVSAGVSNTQETKTTHFSPRWYQFGQRQSSMEGIGIPGMEQLNNSLFANVIKKNRKPQAVLNKTIETEPSFLTVEPVQEEPIETEEGQFIEADEILGSGHEITRYTESFEDYNKPFPKTNSHQKFQNRFSGFNNRRTFAATIQGIKNISAEEAMMLPNQLKSVINGQSASTRKNFISNGNDLLAHPSTKNYYELKNFSVKEVVYIDGFQRDSNANLLLNEPIYKTLGLSDFDQLGKPTLCFLRDYTNEKFNISGEQAVQAINSVFVIADEDITIPQIQDVSSPTSIYSTQDLEYQFMSSNIIKQNNVALTTPITPSPTVEAAPSPVATTGPTRTASNAFGGY
jgi:hypothetical protein